MPQPPTGESQSSVLVIGAGPAGLSTAACLQQRGIAARLVDRRGQPGGAYRDIYAETTLSSPARYNSLPGFALSAGGEYVTARQYRDYLVEYANFHRLHVEQDSIEAIARDAQACAVVFASGETARYRAIVVATGMFEHPILPDFATGRSAGDSAIAPAGPIRERPGTVPILRSPRSKMGLSPSPRTFSDRPVVLHAAAWAGPEPFRGARLLVVGRASSAVEIAEQCAAAGVAVVVAARDKHVRLSRQKILGRDIHHFARWIEPVCQRQSGTGSFCARRPTLPAADLGFSEYLSAGRIQVEKRRSPDRRQTRVEFVGGKALDFDAIVLATGYRFDIPFSAHRRAKARVGHPLADRSEVRGWPNLFLVGFPCARSLASEYLRGIAADAEFVAAQLARRQGR